MSWKLRMPVDVTAHWYGKSRTALSLLLTPLSLLFGAIVALRRLCYRLGVLRTYHFPKPVIVVGNITVGGTGKTPLVIWLAQYLEAKGYQPGIVSRGVGGQGGKEPHWVTLQDDVAMVGDEALLLKQRTACPLVISRDRVAAIYELLSKTSCNVVISDDGLQHYRMGRDIEIAVLDGERLTGNAKLLPAGPLREPVSRLKQIDFLVINGEGETANAYHMQLKTQTLVALKPPARQYAFTDFPTKAINAIAAIGHPARFFQSLTQAGFHVVPHPFPDHHLYRAEELVFNNDYPVFMTEKDAVKCRAFARQDDWYVPVTAEITPAFGEALLSRLTSKH